MAIVYACAPGVPLAREVACAMLEEAAGTGLESAIVFVPTRRACVSLRQAFQRALAGRTAVLPRIIPLSGIDHELIALLGAAAFPVLAAIPPAMQAWQQRDLLCRQVTMFEARRAGGASRIDRALALADELMALQDECARHEVTMTPQALQQLRRGGHAQHWEQAIQFLSILAEFWPQLELQIGLITSAARETALLRALAAYWREHPPAGAVWVVGSTASQPATAALLDSIAALPQGRVVLPGLDCRTDEGAWARIGAGHPLYHLHQWLTQADLSLADLVPLGEAPPSIWAEVLADATSITQWPERALPSIAGVRLVPCQHAEEEARTLALILCEGVAQNKQTALITPDEGLMARVTAHLARVGLVPQRIREGTLATTSAGTLWQALIAAISEPQRLLHLRTLLHHPALGLAPDFLRALEPAWHGLSMRRPGQMPPVPEALRTHHAMATVEMLARESARLSQARLTAAQWVAQCTALLAALPAMRSEGQDALEEALEPLTASSLPPMVIEEFFALLCVQLKTPWRGAGLHADARLVMLTPVEARLEHFDRVVLANLQDAQWPGLAGGSAWLNMAARASLGLPEAAQAVSLMAHDMLVLGSVPEAFLSWPQRDGGSPTTRSRFIERLVTRLASAGIAEDAITDRRYTAWANQLHASSEFAPEPAPHPMPPTHQRPHRLPVSALETLFSDPFSIYARFVLGLSVLNAIDAEPEASDFGSLAHRAIQQLTQHWNDSHSPAAPAQLEKIADHALRPFAEQPAIALFWRARLLRGLAFVNAQEAVRRQDAALQVRSEQTVEAPLTLGGDALVLHGRIDRVEQGRALVLVDYKTGYAASAKDMLNGEGVQLLAYALVLQALGENPEAVEYWQLPRAREAGELHRASMKALEAEGVADALREGLSAMLRETTPFLANPGGDARYDDYDGVSRYDEWAG